MPSESNLSADLIPEPKLYENQSQSPFKGEPQLQSETTALQFDKIRTFYCLDLDPDPYS
jgi:hypothetical protein